jgi:hypothetical protein
VATVGWEQAYHKTFKHSNEMILPVTAVGKNDVYSSNHIQSLVVLKWCGIGG